MNLHNVSFVGSAVSDRQYPQPLYPEIAMVGRSNVGKSSLINKVLNRKNFARVSSKPGKTATINFYELDKTLYLVDLPGYGYAKVSKQEKDKWAVMINDYLENRHTLAAIFLLVDARREPTEDDMLMLSWIQHYQIDFYVIATKIDKLKPSQRDQALALSLETLGIESSRFLPFSAETGEGKEKIIKIIEDFTK